MSASDGGPAFPGVQGDEGHGNMTGSTAPNGENRWTFHNQGMSLRQFYKAAALQGALANPEIVTNKKLVVDHCGLYADAMLAEDKEHSK